MCHFRKIVLCTPGFSTFDPRFRWTVHCPPKSFLLVGSGNSHTICLFWSLEIYQTRLIRHREKSSQRVCFCMFTTLFYGGSIWLLCVIPICNNFLSLLWRWSDKCPYPTLVCQLHDYVYLAYRHSIPVAGTCLFSCEYWTNWTSIYANIQKACFCHNFNHGVNYYSTWCYYTTFNNSPALLSLWSKYHYCSSNREKKYEK